MTYHLPDLKIITNETADNYIIWQPDKKYIVLGRSNDINEAVNPDTATNDNIEIIKRHSGGQTVLLTEKMLIIASKTEDHKLQNPKVYFELFNKKIINALTNAGIKNLFTKGISDITIDDKKIVGSAIYRKDTMVFFHAVLNVSENPDIFAKYLKMPHKQPEYRQNRPHQEFITSLLNEGYVIDIQLLKQILIDIFKSS